MGYIAIVDYGVGNLKSVANAMQYLGFQISIAAESESLERADAIILPGVGAFPDAAEKLREIWSSHGKGWLTEQMPGVSPGYTTLLLYYGSSTYDTAQMARLIDLIVTDCKAQGIETLTPDKYGRSRYLLLDGVQDPGNVGTIWRTADAFGADGLILCGGCADPWGPKTVRATMGAVFRLPVYECSLEEAAERLAQAGVPLYAAALREDTADVRDVSLDRAAVVIGSEGRGVSQEALERCWKTVKIPMRDRCESLNAAVAASVALWEMARND